MAVDDMLYDYFDNLASTLGDLKSRSYIRGEDE